MKALNLGLITIVGTLLGCQDVAFELTEEKVESLKVGKTYVVINEDQPYTNQTEVRLTLHAKNADEMYVTTDPSCESGGEWESYSEQKSWLLHKENEGVPVYVKYRNSSGFDSDCVTDEIIHDNIPPIVSLTKTPASLNNQARAEVGYEIVEELSGIGEVTCWDQDRQVRILCQENGAAWDLQSDGEKNLYVQVVDRAGNKSSVRSTRWIYDGTPPELELALKPGAIVNQQLADFIVESKDLNGVEVVECAVVGSNQFSNCDGMQRYQDLKEGHQVFQYRATDRAGNRSKVKTYKWLIDVTPPTVSFTKTPQKETNEEVAHFEYQAVDTLTSYELFCQKNNEAYRKCGNQTQWKVKQDGRSEFKVKAVDLAGNESAEISHNWLLDTKPPVLNLLETPDGLTNKQSGRLGWNVIEEGSGLKSITCKLRGTDFPCGKDYGTDLPPQKVGNYRAVIMLEDKVGNKKTTRVSWKILQAVKKLVKPLDIQNRGPVDVLFVVDNSSSMNAEQEEMGKRFNNFLNHIIDLDWQVGITTTDTDDSEKYGDGKLVTFEKSNGLRFLDASIPQNRAQYYFKKTIERDEWGSSVEEGIRNTYRAIERMGVDPVHQQFFRKHSHLSVVVLSDENESDDDFRNKPQNLINLVRRQFGTQKTFKFHSIIARPGDDECDFIEHTAGKTYAKLSRLTGGIIGDICADNYSSQLANIGEDIRNLLKRIQLACEPYDQDGDGQPDIEVVFGNPSDAISYHVEGSELVFSEPAPLGNHTVNYTCVDND